MHERAGHCATILQGHKCACSGTFSSNGYVLYSWGSHNLDSTAGCHDSLGLSVPYCFGAFDVLGAHCFGSERHRTGIMNEIVSAAWEEKSRAGVRLILCSSFHWSATAMGTRTKQNNITQCLTALRLSFYSYKRSLWTISQFVTLPMLVLAFAAELGQHRQERQEVQPMYEALITDDSV